MPARAISRTGWIVDRYAAEKIRGFGTTIFAEMSRLSAIHGAINLGQGFPDFAGPDFVKNAAKAAIDADLNQYAIPYGAPRLRRAIAQGWRQATGRELDVDQEITVASGATEVIFDAIQAFLSPGDEMISFEPFYDSYPASAILASARLIPVTLRAPDWSFDRDEFLAALSDRTKLLLINTPHNPTGKVFARNELEWIAGIAQERDLVVLTDEVYDRITYDDVEHVSIATLPGMWERTLTINSTGKTFSMTGWKIGYAIGPANLNAALRAVHQFVTFATATPFQEAMAVAMETAAGNGYYDQLRVDYARRRELMRAAIENAGLKTLPVSGSYFLMADFSGLDFENDIEFCKFLVSDVGVATVPPSVFYSDPARAAKLARFCFAKKDETIAAAAERLIAGRSKIGR